MVVRAPTTVPPSGIYQITGGGLLSGNASGAVTLAAGGSNQDINLTPSPTTGVVVVTSAGNKTQGYMAVRTTGTNGGGITFTDTTTNAGIYTSNTSAAMRFYTNVANGADTNGGVGLVLQGTHLLVGGLTTDGTGVLQFATATTSAGGITMGTDSWLYRKAAGEFGIDSTQGVTRLRLLQNTGNLGCSVYNSSGALGLYSDTALPVTIGTNGTTAITIDSSQQETLGANTTGGATTVTRARKAVTAMADAVATATYTITVPNAAHSAGLQLKIVGSLGAGGAIGANEATGTICYDISIARTAGVNAVATISAAYGSATSSVAGAATITVAAAMSAVSGAVGATNTFTINVTITRGSGASTNHTCVVYAKVVNANASGITIA